MMLCGKDCTIFDGTNHRNPAKIIKSGFCFCKKFKTVFEPENSSLLKVNVFILRLLALVKTCALGLFVSINDTFAT